ncbi:MAG TPA: hypothetical protein PKA63_01830 [Oligoflexia bacterium]|nr:hypothetical protein [Oligoflexia bacterium]HMP47390.1 hypothetical protein [Oligoflexia bacterium]
MQGQEELKRQVLEALSHPEAEQGLYLNNLQVVHEDEERQAVSGTDIEILDALKELISSGMVMVDDSGESVIFKLNETRSK